jgi:FtsH-binding integral membrane protein
MNGQNQIIDVPTKQVLQGLIAISVGILMLLHTFGYLEQGITVFMALFSTGLIIYGLVLTGLYGVIKASLKRKKE